MKRRILRALALLIDIGAPLIATLTQFPIWVDRSAESTVSGLFVAFALLSAVPLFKYFRGKLSTPSAPIMWGLSLALLAGLNAIIEEMILIAFVGLISNSVGLLLFKLAGTEERPKA